MTQKKPTPTIKKAVKQIKARGLLNSHGVKDTELLQVNKPELGLIRMLLGTNGDINPGTGLLSFKGGGGDGDGGGPDRGGGGSSGGGDGGNGGGKGNGGGGMGHDPGHGGAAPGAQGGNSNSNSPDHGPDTSGAGPRGVSRSPNAGQISGVSADVDISGKVGPTDSVNAIEHALFDGAIRGITDISGLGIATDPDQTIDDAGVNYSKALGEEATPGVVERALSFMSPLGIHTLSVNPQHPATFSLGQTHLGLNFGGLAGDLASAVTGLTGLGTIGTAISNNLGVPEMAISGPHAGEMVGPGTFGTPGGIRDTFGGSSTPSGTSKSNTGKEGGYGGLLTSPTVNQALAQSGLLSTVNAPPKPMTPVDPRQVFSYSTYGLPGYSLGAPGYKY